MRNADGALDFGMLLARIGELLDQGCTQDEAGDIAAAEWEAAGGTTEPIKEQR